MSIKITNAKIKSRLFLSYGYSVKENNIENKIPTCSSDAPIHEDLERAFDNLIPHFIIITEESEITDKLRNLITRPNNEDFILPEDIEKKYKVTGITISGAEDNEGVTISGLKYLKTGKSVSFNTPDKKFDDEEYEFTDELYQAVEHLKSEVLEYMDGKHGTKMVVGSFNFDEDDEENDSFKLPEDNDIQSIKDQLSKDLKGVTVVVSGSRVFDEEIQDPDYEDVTGKDE